MFFHNHHNQQAWGRTKIERANVTDPRSVFGGHNLLRSLSLSLDAYSMGVRMYILGLICEANKEFYMEDPIIC